MSPQLGPKTLEAINKLNRLCEIATEVLRDDRDFNERRQAAYATLMRLYPTAHADDRVAEYAEATRVYTALHEEYVRRSKLRLDISTAKTMLRQVFAEEHCPNLVASSSS